jgi:hypothetical protein
LRVTPPVPWPGPYPVGRRDARYPHYLGALVDMLAEHDYQLAPAAAALGLSTGRLVRLLAQDDDLWSHVNQSRQARGHHALRRE